MCSEINSKIVIILCLKCFLFNYFHEQVKVHFVDYGDNASLDISMLHVLPNSFRRLPFQAFRCKLEGEFLTLRRSFLIFY